LGSDIVDALPQLVRDLDPATGPLPLALGGARLGQPDTPVFGELASFLGLSEGSGWAAVLGKSSSTGAFGSDARSQHPGVSALFLLALRRSVVHEPAGSGGVLDLVANPDQTWLGAPIEVQRAPVTGGVAGFGIRWHGERPAVLWDIATSTGTAALVSSGLDASWSGQGAKGEALMASTAGLALGPSTPKAQPTKARGIDKDADVEPDSFC